MSDREHWDANYAEGFLPWDTGVPDPLLVELIEGGSVPVGRALEVGCGTGTNAVWLATKRFEVVALDLAPRAVAMAQARAAATGVRVDLRAADFLNDPLDLAPFDFVFDRGCFHVFDAAADQDRFAARVAGLLAPGGRWLSIIGSTEGAARDVGPPRRSLRDVAAAVEPHLEIVEIRRIALDPDPTHPVAWLLLAGVRTAPAQPSTRRSAG